MKLFPFFSIVILCVTISFISCDSNADVKESARESLGDVTPPAATPPPGATPPATPEPPQNADGVWHYTCSNGCAGGAGAAGPCAVCGNTLAHNTAYHNNAGTPAATPPPGAATPPAITPPAAKAPEPAQNAAGVWHYTCPKGCAGGGGAAAPCGTCGATLAHNSGYH